LWATQGIEEEKMKSYNTDVAVIGAGAAGLSAALAASREGARVLLIERNEDSGGILNQCIHNGFGLHYFKTELTGPEYAFRLAQMIEEKSIEVLTQRYLLDIDSQKKQIKVVSEKGIEFINTKSVVYTCGARERPFGSLLVPSSRACGVYTAGVAQRFINLENKMIGKSAIILGSGDIGLIMARRLTLEGVKVQAVIERMPYPGGLVRNINQCLKDFDIPLYLSHTVTQVRGDARINEVVVCQVDEKYCAVPQTEKIFSVDTLILSVGLIPETSKLYGKVNLDPSTKGVIIDSNGQSSDPFIFAAGNCVIVYDLVDYVSAEGENAGRNAALYAAGKEQDEKIKIEKGNNIGIINPSFYVRNTALDIYARVRKPVEKASFVVRDSDEVIFSVKNKSYVPSEMIQIKIDKEKLSRVKKLTVEVI